jgi:hypothetical protein
MILTLLFTMGDIRMPRRTFGPQAKGGNMGGKLYNEEILNLYS